jgi:cytoskeleton protein RodZ
LASFDIGAKLRQERVGQGLAISDIARDTRIAPRFLEAIETDDFAHLPGLIFTRNFVRQYAVSLKLDPDPLLAELPKQDESTVQLPTPPARPRSSYHQDRAMHSALSSAIWLMIAGGAGVAAYLHFNHGAHSSVSSAPVAAIPASVSAAPPLPVSAAVAATAPAAQPASAEVQTSQPLPPAPSQGMPVKVTMTASETAWVQVSADSKTTFTGTMQSNETREIDASAQVKILTGNAGALRISLNGKTLDSLGPVGQVRFVRLTAEGPQLLSKAPQPVPPDPL